MTQPETRAAGPDHRWLILGVIALAQFMIILDATIMNIALPSAQKSLGFSIVDRQWVVTAYALALGSLLLGGKLSDLLGRRSAARRSRYTARSPGRAARSGCCWAGCSPSTCPGGGACMST
jgi:MFS family permease